MGKYFDKDGKEIEAFLPEEVEAQKKVALDEYVAKNPDKGAELTKITTDLADTKKKLEDALAAGGDDKDENIKNLRAAVKTATEATKAVETKLTGEIETIKNQGTTEFKNEVFDSLAQGDKEMRKKIEAFYDGFKGAATTKAEVRERALNAAKLASDKPLAPSFLAGIGGAGDRGNGGAPGATVQESENGRAQRAVLGITDEQAKKYGPTS